MFRWGDWVGWWACRGSFLDLSNLDVGLGDV